MTEINLTAYFKLPEDQKQIINEIILADLESAPKGLKMTFAAANYDVERVLDATYRGYLAEKKVLDYLQQKNPEQDWHFLDLSAGCYHLNYQISNKPDLINNFGITVEVKRYIFYQNNIYFVSCLSDINKLWQQFFHGADFVIVIDTNQNLAVLFNFEQFKANVSTETNNLDSFKTTYKLDITNLAKTKF